MSEAFENETVEVDHSEAEVEPVDELSELKELVKERTEDLQRLQAEYVNYKKRVDRDRQVARQSGIEALLRDMMPAFDSIIAAEKMDALDGGFKLTADEFVKVARQYGMHRVGKVGEDFDPLVHEALMQVPVAGEGEPKVHEVMQVGYQLGDQTLRPARVVVAMPSGEADEPNEAQPQQDDAEPTQDSGQDVEAEGETPSQAATAE